jgi:endonuclease/exonuclease/phosphatase family metal-dependent hydrolase
MAGSRHAWAAWAGLRRVREPGDGGTGEEGRPYMIIASLNLHGGRGADGTPFDVVTACGQLKADMILLQETWRPAGQSDPVVEAAQALGARLIRADLVTGTSLRRLAIAPDPGRGRWGLAVITARSVTGYELVDLGRCWSDPIGRAAQIVTVATPGGESLRVVNTHLTHRYFSPLQLVRLTRYLAASTAPTVIAGDLNMPWPVTGLAVGYSPAVRGRTFPAHRPLVQLDHLLTSRAVRASDGRVMPPAGSDHLPIRAYVQVG